MMIIERTGSTYRLTFVTVGHKLESTRVRHHGRKKYHTQLVTTHTGHPITISEATAQQLFNALYEAGTINQDSISRYSDDPECPHWAILVTGETQ